MKLVLASLLAMAGTTYAQAPALPQLAVCKDGVCTMRETDYVQFQAFAKRLRDYAENAQRVDEEKETFILRIRSALESCIVQRDGHKGGWSR